MKPYIFSIFMMIPTGVFATEIPMDKIQECFAEPDRLDRLLCYDTVLGRPGTKMPEHEDVVVAPPESIQMFEDLSASAHLSEHNVKITLRDGPTGFDISPPENTDMVRFLEQKAAEGDHQEFIYNHDIFLTLQGSFEDQKQGGLIISCENQITNIRFLWDSPLKGRVVPVRVRFGDSLDETQNSRYLKMRTSEDRYFALSPRGLESISLLADMASGTLAQVSVGTNENLQSVFYDAAAVNDALNIVSRHCSWSASSHRQGN